MNKLEHLVKTAFDDVQMPEGLEDDTMAYVLQHAPKVDSENNAAIQVDAATERAQQDDCSPGPDASQTAAASPARRRKVTASRWFRVAAACTLVFVLCAGGIGTYAAYATETASATVQATGNVRLGVNRFGNVLTVEFNESDFDESTRTAIESLRGMTFDQALDKLLQEDALASSVESGNIEVKIACGDASQESTMKQQCQECIGKHVRKRDGSGEGHGNGSGEGSGASHGDGSSEGHGNSGSGNKNNNCSETTQGSTNGNHASGHHNSEQ